MSGIPALKDPGRQEGQEFKQTFSYIVSSRPGWATEDSDSKNQNKKEVKKPIPGTIIWSEALGGNYSYYIAKWA